MSGVTCRRDSRTCRWALWLLLALAAAFFWRLWLEPDGFLHRPNSLYSDLTITHWPNALFIRHSLAAWGQVPLWRPLILGGEPFAANPLSGLWYPPNLLLLILPLTFAFNLLFILHTAWAGWGGYLLARSVGASRAGGLLAAFTLMFAPKAVAHLASGHVGLYCAWAWLPWMLWAVRRLAERGGAGDVATAAAAAAMMVLADVRLGFYGGLAAAGYWMCRVYVGRRGGCKEGERKEGEHKEGEHKEGEHKVRPYYRAGVAAGLLAVALVAVQMVPLAAVAGRLNRGGLSVEESSVPSLPPRYLLGVLIADHGGFGEWMTYLGVIGLLLVLLALTRWRSRERWWWGGLALAAGIYSLGIHTPLYGLLYRVLPLLRWLRGPARAWFLVVLAAGVLAAQGMTALQKGTRLRRRPAVLLAVALAGAALAGGAGGLALHLPANVVVAAVIWPLAGMLIALRAGRRLQASLFAGLALALALADLWGVGFTIYRVRPADDVLAEGEMAAVWLADQARPFRVYSPSYSIPQHTGVVYGIETADGVDPFQLADYVAFMRVATQVGLPDYGVTVPSFPEMEPGENLLLAHRDVVPDLRLLGLLNVRHLAAAYPMEVEGLVATGERDGVYLYRNELVLPRAFVVGQVETVDGLEAALAWLAENDPGRAAVVEEGRGTGWQRPALSAVEGSRGAEEARIVRWTPNRIDVEAKGPGLLVLSEVYDPDWRAEVDGRAVEIVRADGVLRGVFLEEGLHRTVFSYWPTGLGAGCGATAAGWVCTMVLWVVGWRGERHLQTPASSSEESFHDSSKREV